MVGTVEEVRIVRSWTYIDYILTYQLDLLMGWLRNVEGSKEAGTTPGHMQDPA